MLIQKKFKHDLAAKNVIPEEWGGDTIFIPISALTGEGVDALLDSASHYKQKYSSLRLLIKVLQLVSCN
jgi:translation initiation factor IF-2